MKNPRGAAAAIGICAVLLLPPLAQGLGGQTVQSDLRRAIELVEEGDFAAAADLLEAITTGPEDLAAEARDMVLAYLYLGISRLYLADDDDAREAFHDAQRLDPAFQPEAAELPRRVVEVWEEVRELGRARGGHYPFGGGRVPGRCDVRPLACRHHDAGAG